MATNLENKIGRVATNVTDALNAIAAKGVDITGMNSDNLAALIASLATSGGGKVVTGEFTFGSGNNHTITHNLGEIPNFAVAITDTPTKTGKGFVVACMVFGGVEYLIYNKSSYSYSLLFETNDTDMTSSSSGTFKQATDTTIKYAAGVTGVSGVGIYYAVGVI